MTWLSAYQGATSPISALYKVTGYPTYVLIGADGRGLTDGCAAFSAETHERSIADLSTIATPATCADAALLLRGSRDDS